MNLIEIHHKPLGHAGVFDLALSLDASQSPNSQRLVWVHDSPSHAGAFTMSGLRRMLTCPCEVAQARGFDSPRPTAPHITSRLSSGWVVYQTWQQPQQPIHKWSSGNIVKITPVHYVHGVSLSTPHHGLLLSKIPSVIVVHPLYDFQNTVEIFHEMFVQASRQMYDHKILARHRIVQWSPETVD